MKAKIAVTLFMVMIMLAGVMQVSVVRADDTVLHIVNVTVTKTKTGDILITPEDLYKYMGVGPDVSALNIDMSGLKGEIEK